MTDTTLPLARKFEILLETIRTPSGKRHLLVDMAEDTGITLNTLSRFKLGQIKNPRLSSLSLISDYFGVPMDYFRCESEEECYRYLLSGNYRHRTVSEIARRMRQLLENVLEDIVNIMNYIEIVEKFDSEVKENGQSEISNGTEV